MKKLFAFILVLTLVLSMGSIVFASQVEPDGEVEAAEEVETIEEGVEPAHHGGGGGGGSDYEDTSSVTIKKELTVTRNMINPEETFQFTIGNGLGEKDGKEITAPEFEQSEFEIAISEGSKSGSKEINLPKFSQVGVYTYPITETQGDTAGMQYDNETKNLVITVINNPKYGQPRQPKFLRVITMTNKKEKIKVDSFRNSFQAGNLTFEKKVTGNYGSPNDIFEVKVTLTPKSGKNINIDPIKADGGSLIKNSSTGVVTITYASVKGSNKFTIKNIPYDVRYEVEETEPGEYEVSYKNRSGEIKQNSIETTITNKRDIKIDTGINLDSLPYLIILVVAIGGLAIFIVRRRMAINE